VARLEPPQQLSKLNVRQKKLTTMLLIPAWTHRANSVNQLPAADAYRHFVQDVGDG
jgi:hypothetical protein